MTRHSLLPDQCALRALTIVAVALATACMLAACGDKSAAQAIAAKKAPPAVPVLTGQVVEKSVPLRLHAIGNVETVASVAQLYLGNILYAIELAALSLEDEDKTEDAAFYRGIGRKLADAHGRARP